MRTTSTSSPQKAIRKTKTSVAMMPTMIMRLRLLEGSPRYILESGKMFDEFKSVYLFYYLIVK